MMTCTFQNDEEVFSKVVELYRGTVEKLNGTSGTWYFGNQYHPVPKLYAQHSVEKGGNVLGLERASSNLVRKSFSLPVRDNRWALSKGMY